MNRTREIGILLQVCNEMNRNKESLQLACRKCKEDWINVNLNPTKIVYRVEGCLLVAAMFMIILAIGTPRRRQSRSIIIRYGVEGVIILSFPLLSYTLGMMQGQIIKNELYPVWAMFLAMLFGGTNAMSVQKLDENRQPMKLYFDFLVFTFYFGIVLNGLFVTARGDSPYTYYVAIAIGGLLGGKNTEQWATAKLASKPSSENNIKWLASYMKSEHQLSTSYNPHTMQGYKYPVFIHLKRLVTLDEIWCDSIGVLASCNSTPICRLKDLCLSFSLFHLVVRRYFGYTSPESKLDKTRALVVEGLLRTEQNCERAFQVIEAELAFVHDFFFTKYAFIMYGKEIFCCALTLTLTFASIAVVTWSISVLNTHGSILDDHLVKTSSLDIVVTKIALVALSIYELLQIWSYCVSDWAKVSLVCKYVTRSSWQGNACIEKLLLLAGRPHRWLRYWRNTIDQYSVLDSFSSSYWDRLKHLLPSGKAGTPVELSMEVKKAIARTIKNSINGHLTNGVSTLMRHDMSDGLCWACLIDDEFTLTHSILAWHIATSYCEISGTTGSLEENIVHKNKVVATSLSKYCAYLVAFAPKLLPGSPADTEATLNDLEREAKATLQDLVSPREKYDKLTELHDAATETMPPQLLAKGVMLGKAVQSMQNLEKQWDLLADFWAEMLVYIAPSDNVAGHIELLPQGGEFVTHVWALLMHAGVLERPTAAAATAVA